MFHDEQTFIFSVGILYAYCIGPYVSYILFQVLCLIIPIVFIVLFAFMPDSPHYHISNGNRHQATKALKFLRGKNADGVKEELDEIQESVVEAMSHRAGVFEVFKGKANFLGEEEEIFVDFNFSYNFFH